MIEGMQDVQGIHTKGHEFDRSSIPFWGVGVRVVRVVRVRVVGMRIVGVRVVRVVRMRGVGMRLVRVVGMGLVGMRAVEMAAAA